MKARLLKKILNNTGYAVTNNKNYIAIGSAYCHDLITVNKNTLHLKYAFDTFKKGRQSINNPKLEFIWDKLKELIDNGKIKDIIEGSDNIDKPLSVYTIEDGKLIETFTDEYGWPNVTIDGYLMYDNTYFKNKVDAINSGIEGCKLGISSYNITIEETNNKLEKLKDRLALERNDLKHLESL